MLMKVFVAFVVLLVAICHKTLSCYAYSSVVSRVGGYGGPKKEEWQISRMIVIEPVVSSGPRSPYTFSSDVRYYTHTVT